MNYSPADVEFLRHVCRGREDAMAFLVAWREYVEAIDDIVDCDRVDSEFIIRTFGLANVLYATPFYLNHARELHLLVQLVTNAYADSVAWEKSSVKWQRDVADVIRHNGAEMLRAVAFICGGYDHLRGLSATVHTSCYQFHHDAEGRPT